MAIDSLTQSLYGAPIRRPFQPVQGNDAVGGNENPAGGGGPRPVSPPDVMAAMQAMMQQGQQGAQLRAQGQHEFLFPEASRHLGIGGAEMTADNPSGNPGGPHNWVGPHSWETNNPTLGGGGANLQDRAVSMQQNALTPAHMGAPQGTATQAPPTNPWEAPFTGNQSNLAPLPGPQPVFGPGSGMAGKPIPLPDSLAKPPPGYKGPATQTYGPSPSPGAPGFVPPRF